MAPNRSQFLSALSQPATEDASLLALAEAVGNMGHWVWHVADDEMTWSDQVNVIFGFDTQKIKPSLSAFLDAIHPADLNQVQAHIERALRDGTDIEYDARIIRGDGEVRSIIVKGQLEWNASGGVASISGVITDVTAAFNTLRAVRDQKDMLDLAARVAELGHWVWDAGTGELSYCSENLARMYGFGAAVLPKQVRQPEDFAATIHPDEQSSYRETVTGALAEGKAYDIRYRKLINGEVRHIREIGQPVHDAAGVLQRYIAAVQDVTEASRREVEIEEAWRQLEAKTRQLEDAVRAKDQLFSIIGHDLKSPFNNIIGFASLLADRGGSLSTEKVSEYGRLILESAENTNALLDNLLAWAVNQDDNQPVNSVPIELRPAVDDGIQTMSLLAKAKGIDVVNAVNHICVSADRDMVLTVFRNLINNAIKFTRPGDTVTVCAEPDELSGQGMVRVSVIDTGIGIDVAQVQRLLQKDSNATTAGTHGERGSGLGLRLSSDLVQRQGGRLWVEACPEGGSAIHFTLPSAV